MALLGFVQNFLTKREGVKEYAEKLKLFMEDSHLSENEKKELKELASKYGLTEKDMEKMHKLAAGDFFKNISADQRITEDERQSLNALINHFGLDLKGTHFDQKTFNKYYILGLIDNGVLPEISNEHHDVNIQFKGGEIMHFATAAILRKHKTITKKVNYGGFSTSIKICKGVRYRVGSINLGRQTEQILAAEDAGIFYFTNQRLGFLGKKKQFSLPYSKIQSFDLTGEGLFIFKEGKETPYILTMDDYEVPCAIVSFMLNQP